MNNRFEKARTLLSQLTPTIDEINPYYNDDDKSNVALRVKDIQLAFTQTPLLAADVKEKAMHAANRLRMQLLQLQRQLQQPSHESENRISQLRIIDNNLLLLAQYFPSNLAENFTTCALCPLANQLIKPEDSRFVLSNGMHLSLNGIIDFATYSKTTRIDAFFTEDNISLTDRDKDRLELFLLKYRQNKAQSIGAVRGGAVGFMVGGTGAKIALVCGYYGASSATLLLSATFILPLIIFGLIGVAAGHYMNSPGARGEELKRKIGDVVGNMPFQDISNPADQRWGSSMWKTAKNYANHVTCLNPCGQDDAARPSSR